MSTVKLSDELVAEAKKFAGVYNRSVPKQIEHWSRIGKIVEENPDLSYKFITDILLAKDEGDDFYSFEAFTEWATKKDERAFAKLKPSSGK